MINYFDSISEIANRIFTNLVNGTNIELNISGFDPITAAIIQFVIVTAISYVLAPKPKAPRFNAQDEIKGVTLSKDSNNNPIPIVYGKRQVGLTRVFVESSGADNQYLYVAGVLCEGGGSGITAIDEIYVDDKLVQFDGILTHGTIREVSGGDKNYYKGGESLISVQGFFGLDNQSASSLLDETTNWTENHKLSGLAYVALRFKWNQDSYSGLPEVRVTVRGKKIYDPRLDSTKGGSGSHRQDDPTTWAYSANSSLVLLDYLRNSRYGKGLPNDAFEDEYDTFKTSANTADVEIVPYTTILSSAVGLLSEEFDGYFNDNLNHFGVRFATSEQTVTSISGVTTSPYRSRRFYGYFNPTTTGSYFFKTTSDDSSLFYVGTAGQEIGNLFTTLESAPSFNDSSISSYLKVNNSGWHGNQTIESSGVSLVSGQSYPVILYYGNAPTDSNLTFEWKISAGSYSTDLSIVFDDGLVDGVPAVKQFESNAVLDTEKKIIENVRELLVPMRAIFNYTQGQYKIIIEGTGSSQLLLTKDNVVSEVKIQGESKSEKYNRVIGTYTNPKKDYQSDTVSFPPFDDSSLPIEDRHATLLSEDNDTLLERTVDMLQITSPYQAEEICENILRRSRNNLKAEVTATAEALNLSIGDIVTATYDTAGFVAKPFRVMSLAINSDSTVSLGLEEHQNSFYTFASKNKEAIIADTVLPNPFSVMSPAISVSDEVIELFDGSVVSKMVVTLTNNDNFADEFEVEYKQNTETFFRLMGRGINQVFEIYPVIEGAIYNIRARTINTLGVRSSFATATHEVVTAFLPPSDISTYNIDVVGDKLHHFWTGINDLDLDFYEIRFTSDTTETLYSNTTILVPKIGRPATSVETPFLGSGKFFIKAVDKFGIRSANSTSVVVSSQVFEGFQSVQTITEETAFSGTKTNCAVVDNTLVLNTSAFDSISGDFDDGLGLFDGGDNTVVGSGTYEFASGFDFSNSFKFKVILNQLNVDHLDYIDNFDSQAGDFDDVEGLFDGGSGEAISTNVQLQIATSTDNVTFSSFNDFKSGDYVARAVKFKAILTSTDTSATPAINNLSLKFLLPTVIQDGSNQSSGTNNTGFPVNFTKAFYQTPSLTIIGQNLNSGDRFILNSKDRSSFNVEFLDSSGNTVNRTFDYQAVGIGSQQ
jgi:hypothetical protein